MNNMGEFQNLTGNKYALLTVLDEHKKSHDGKTIWKCQCQCGNITYVIARDLKNGNTKSCGCLKLKTSNEKYNYKNSKRLYTIYYGIKARCYKSTSPKYKDYGARGIIMCEEWLNSFESFCDWALSNGYSDNLSIDRIDCNGNYEPTNCRWTTSLIQGQNTRSTKLITYNGKTQPMSRWAKELNMNASSLRYLIVNKNMSLEEIIDKLR